MVTKPSNNFYTMDYRWRYSLLFLSCQTDPGLGACLRCSVRCDGISKCPKYLLGHVLDAFSTWFFICIQSLHSYTNTVCIHNPAHPFFKARIEIIPTQGLVTSISIFFSDWDCHLAESVKLGIYMQTMANGHYMESPKFGKK